MLVATSKLASSSFIRTARNRLQSYRNTYAARMSTAAITLAKERFLADLNPPVCSLAISGPWASLTKEESESCDASGAKEREEVYAEAMRR